MTENCGSCFSNTVWRFNLLPWELCMWFQWMWNWPLRAGSISSLIPAEHIPNWSNLSWRNSKGDKFHLGLSFVMNIALGLTVRIFLKAWGKAEPSLTCSASPPEQQADAVEGVLFQEYLKLWLCLGFAWSVQVHWACGPLRGIWTSTIKVHYSHGQVKRVRSPHGTHLISFRLSFD